MIGSGGTLLEGKCRLIELCAIGGQYTLSAIIGSCIEAGYNDSCCQHGYCAGYPFTCFCDRECYNREDCCGDIEDVCPEGNICY